MFTFHVTENNSKKNQYLESFCFQIFSDLNKGKEKDSIVKLKQQSIERNILNLFEPLDTLHISPNFTKDNIHK